LHFKGYSDHQSNFVQILTTKDNDSQYDIYCLKLMAIFRSLLDFYVCPYAFNDINSLFTVNHTIKFYSGYVSTEH